jgi:hypothetical protein
MTRKWVAIGSITRKNRHLNVSNKTVNGSSNNLLAVGTVWLYALCLQCHQFHHRVQLLQPKRNALVKISRLRSMWSTLCLASLTPQSGTRALARQSTWSTVIWWTSMAGFRIFITG